MNWKMQARAAKPIVAMFNSDRSALVGRQVFLTGATGYVGGHLLSALQGSGCVVHALARTKAKAAELAGLGAIPVVGNLENPNTWRPLFSRIDAVIHLAMPYDETGEEMLDVDADFSEKVLRFQKLESQDSLFIYTSNLFLFQNCLPSLASEGSALPIDLENQRVDLEQRLLEGSSLKNAVAIIRLGWVYGGGDTLADAFAAYPLIADDRLRMSRVPLVHIDDVASLYLGILAARVGGCFHACEPEPMTADDIANCLGRESIRAKDASFLARILAHDRGFTAKASVEAGWRAGHRFVEWARSAAGPERADG